MDITIMGKKTFNEIQNIENIDNLYLTTKNYVFTHSESLSVKGFIPINYDIVEFVKKIGKDKNIWIVGGNTIIAPLLDNDMVDNMIIQIAPVLLGIGIPLFSQKEALKRFYLKEVKKYGQFAELILCKLIQ
jgi:dihydrofolate reductase